MISKPITMLFALLKQQLQKAADAINHESVMKDIVLETELSPGYFLMLTLANLIALAGLITNSSPVIIGAMLISPLMGPILSFGFAFITGAKQIWIKSVRKISMSVGLTIAVAAAASSLSPINEITHEILIRTRPNLYDLIIAFLAGFAGAAALCTKKNYLTVVPGVAIATAVIPPLSVSGFGIGVWSLNLFFGGFLLFFANAVAITIATAIVFFLYGFRPRMITEADMSQLRRRLLYLGGVLLVISIPLIYTLHTSIVEIRLRAGLEQVLKRTFDVEQRSRLTAFDYSRKADGTLTVHAVIDVVNYLSEEDIARAEKALDNAADSKAKLVIDQVKVQPGGLKHELVKTIVPTMRQPPTPESILSSRENVMAGVRQSMEKIEKIIAPSTTSGFHVGFQDKTNSMELTIKVKRDTPITEEERLWIRRLLASELGLPVDLTIETVPFVPLLVFGPEKTAVTDEMKSMLTTVKEAFNRDKGLIIKIEAYPGTSNAPEKGRKLSQMRIATVERYLIAECGVPRSQILSSIREEVEKRASVKVSVLAEWPARK